MTIFFAGPTTRVAQSITEGTFWIFFFFRCQQWRRRMVVSCKHVAGVIMMMDLWLQLTVLCGFWGICLWRFCCHPTRLKYSCMWVTFYWRAWTFSYPKVDRNKMNAKQAIKKPLSGSTISSDWEGFPVADFPAPASYTNWIIQLTWHTSQVAACCDAKG